jgi:hypothetical protein
MAFIAGVAEEYQGASCHASHLKVLPFYRSFLDANVLKSAIKESSVP